MFNMQPMKEPATTQDPYHEAAKLCQTVHDDYAFTLLTFKRKSPSGAQDSGHNPYVPISSNFATYEEHAALFQSYARQGIEPFMVVAATDGNGHKDANVLHTYALGVDFDHGYPDCLVNNPLISPSLRVETSPGHYHALWMLDQPCSPDDAKVVLKAMALRLGGDVAFAKVSQIVRLPGFVHSKRGSVARLVESSNLTKLFSLDFIKDAFDVDLISNCLRATHPKFNDCLEIPRSGSPDEDSAQQVEDVESALPFLRDDADDYSDWLTTLMALVPLGVKGKELAEQFSRYSTKFNAQAFELKWRQIQSSAGSIGTIFLRAQKNGWTNPGFRNHDIDKTQTLTDRDFGRMIAAELCNKLAVIESYRGDKRHLDFLEWNHVIFRPMSEINCRAVVEKAGKTVISKLSERHGLHPDVIKRLQHKVGNNRSLTEVCEHVAEALVLSSQSRIVGNYPYFVLENGVINLISQELIPVQWRPVPVKGRSPITLDPTATAPVFEKMVREIFEDDNDLIQYFYRVIGYMLLGKQKAQIFVIFFGPSSNNGKSTILNILKHVMGGYACTLPTTSIMIKSHVSDGATPSTAQLEGKRMAEVSELNDKQSLDSGLVKQMTGDLEMPVRRNYESAKTIAIEFLLIMSTNKLPRVDEGDHGLWRRTQIIPFDRRFKEEEVDADLPDKLRLETSGILNLMLAGARDYMMNGLKPPAKVLAAKAEQRKAVDPMANFIDEATDIGGDAETPLKILFAAYEIWRLGYPDFPRLTKHQFQKKLEEKKFVRSVRGNCPCFHGICLKASTD
jgi:P4 family phage/plasmid primase-like protien